MILEHGFRECASVFSACASLRLQLFGGRSAVSGYATERRESAHMCALAARLCVQCIDVYIGTRAWYARTHAGVVCMCVKLSSEYTECFVCVLVVLYRVWLVSRIRPFFFPVLRANGVWAASAACACFLHAGQCGYVNNKVRSAFAAFSASCGLTQHAWDKGYDKRTSLLSCVCERNIRSWTVARGAPAELFIDLHTRYCGYDFRAATMILLLRHSLVPLVSTH